MNVLKKLAALAAISVLASGSAATAATYSMDVSIGGGSVTGYFETDGTLGALSSANFTDWSLTIEAPDVNGGVATTSSQSGGQSLSLASGLSATATDLLFDFDISDLFYTYTDSGDFWCVAGSSSGCYVGSAMVIGYSDTTGNQAGVLAYSGVQSILGSGGSSAAELTSAVPLPAALPLLLFGLGGLGVAARRRKAA